jgi:DNA polymerase-3 subunit delta
LAKGAVAPVYLIVAPQPFLGDEAVRQVAGAVEARSGEPSTTSYDAEADLATVLDDLKTPDLFASGRVVTVRPADRLVQTHVEVLAAYAASPAPGAHLLLVVGSLVGETKSGRKRRKPLKAVEQFARTVQKQHGLVTCSAVYERDLVPWIHARVRSLDRQIEPAAASLLAEFIGTDLAVLANELDKLTVYLGDRKRITTGDVEAVSLRDHGRIIYELTDAIGRASPADGLAVLNRLLDQGERPSRVLFFISRHMRQLWVVKERIANGEPPDTAARNVGVRYFVEKFLAQVNAFSLRQLRRNCSALTACEAKLKRSAEDDRILLETTLLGLLDRSRPRGRTA